LPVQPFDPHPSVNAGSSSVASFVWLDSTDTPDAPASLRSRLDNLTDYQNVTPWTAITPPASSTTITLTPSQNTMLRTWRDRQWMQVTVEATMDDGTVQTKLWVYELIAMIRP
jgi:hypothetical protein